MNTLEYVLLHDDGSLSTPEQIVAKAERIFGFRDESGHMEYSSFNRMEEMYAINEELYGV